MKNWLVLLAITTCIAISFGLISQFSTSPMDQEMELLDFDDCGEPEFVHLDFDDCGEPEFVHL